MLKTIEYEIQTYTPERERGLEKPTIIHGIPMSKGDYDKYQDSIKSRIKGKQLILERAASLVRIYRSRIKKLENVMINNTEHDEVTDPNQIVYFMTHLNDVETGSEIDNWLMGISSLSEEEEKNSCGESELEG